MVFGQYAKYYDVIYGRKSYRRECLYLERLFRRHAKRQVKTILDLGCGTANHMIPFLEKGYAVTGIDASGEMLKHAGQKLSRRDLKAELIRGKLQSFHLNKKFDTVLCLFSVINYLVREKDLSSTLENVVSNMKKTSVFIFDFWNKPAVEAYYTPRKKNIFAIDGMSLERRSKTKIYPRKSLCEVNYTCSLRRNGRLLERNQEKHVVRYFSVEEMAGYLKEAGLRPVDVHPFMNPKGKIKKNTWDVTMVAQKI